MTKQRFARLGIGAVPTPAELARRLVEPLVARAGRQQPILDPSCGDGALLAAARELGGPGFELHGIEIDAAAANRARARLGPQARIVVADALDTAWPAGAIVISNPPWVSFSGRQAGSGRPQGSAADSGWPSLHGAFLAHIAAYVRVHQTAAAVLLPASISALEGYADLRRRVDEAVQRVEIVELGERAFAGVTEPAILLRLEPHVSSSKPTTPWTSTSRGDQEWLALLREFPRLPHRTFADPGVHTGNAARELIHRPRGTRPGVREGRSLSAFRLDEPTAGLETTLARTPERRFRIAQPEHYAGFPILLRQTANRPIAALHTEPTYFRNSLLGMRTVPGLEPACALALLNGPVAAAWHRASFLDARQKSFPQVKVGHLATQPFPLLRRDDNPGLHDRLVRCAERLARTQPEQPQHDRELARLTLGAFGLEGRAAERVLELAQ